MAATIHRGRQHRRRRGRLSSPVMFWHLFAKIIGLHAAIRYDSTVSCGLPCEPNVDDADIIPLPTALVGEGKFFILTAKGDSMTGIGVDNGDLVIVREQNRCNDGDYAVVLVNESEMLLKTVTYLPDQNAYLLHAENPAYEDRIERNVRIQGVATQIIKNLR